MRQEAKGPQAAQWRKRKYVQLRLFNIPPDILPGSFVRTKVTCGKPNCHCASGEGHHHWTLTFMSDGKRRVIHIPNEMVDDVAQRVQAGKAFQNAVREVLTANAELLVLAKKKSREQVRKKPERGVR